MEQHFVLLPGLDGTGKLFDVFVNALQGQSEKPLNIHIISLPQLQGECIQYAQIAEAVVCKLEALNSSLNGRLKAEPFTIIAESFSSALLPFILQKTTLPISKLVLVAGFLSTPRPLLFNILQRLPLHALISMKALSYPVLLVCLGGKGLGEKLYDKKCLGKYSDEQLSANTFLSVVRGMQRNEFNQRMHAIKQLRIPAEQFHIPVLYIQAKHDLFVNNQWAKFRETFPEAQCVRLPGPHFILQSQALCCAMAVLEFCRVERKDS